MDSEEYKKSSRTATHFIARPRKYVEGGYAIILYRYARGGTILRPQYMGPLGWSFHSSQKDEDVEQELQPIRKLKEVTGDDLEKWEFTGLNIYAG